MLITEILLKFVKDEYKRFDKAKLDTTEKETSNACLSLLARIAAIFQARGLLSDEDYKEIHDAAFGE